MEEKPTSLELLWELSLQDSMGMENPVLPGAVADLIFLGDSTCHNEALCLNTLLRGPPRKGFTGSTSLPPHQPQYSSPGSAASLEREGSRCPPPRPQSHSGESACLL